MEYKLGNLLKIRDVGETEKLTCPECKKQARFRVFVNAGSSLNRSFPFLKINYVYFLVCPACAARFAVDEDLGDALAAGEALAIGNFDLKKLKKFKADD